MRQIFNLSDEMGSMSNSPGLSPYILILVIATFPADNKLGVVLLTGTVKGKKVLVRYIYTY